MLSDIDQTVLLNYAWEVAKYPERYFEDFAGNEDAILSYCEELVASLLVEKNVREIGEIVALAHAGQPDKFLYCNGDERLIADFPELASVLGTLWGEPTLGEDYFVLPDYRNKFLLGFAQGGGSPAFAASGGAATHTLAASEIPAHSHKMLASNTGASSTHLTFAAAAGNDTPTGDFGTFDNTGGGGAHNNMPPYRAINYVIYAGR